jgi:hypothetical protein
MNTNASTSKQLPTLYGFYLRLRQEIQSPFNELVTGKAINREPDFDDKLTHYEGNKGRISFIARFEAEHPGFLDSLPSSVPNMSVLDLSSTTCHI